MEKIFIAGSFSYLQCLSRGTKFLGFRQPNPNPLSASECRRASWCSSKLGLCCCWSRLCLAGIVNYLLSGVSCRGPLEGDEDRRRDGDKRILEAPAIASDPQRIQLDIKQCTALIKQLVSVCPAAVITYAQPREQYLPH